MIIISWPYIIVNIIGIQAYHSINGSRFVCPNERSKFFSNLFEKNKKRCTNEPVNVNREVVDRRSTKEPNKKDQRLVVFFVVVIGHN